MSRGESDHSQWLSSLEQLAICLYLCTLEFSFSKSSETLRAGVATQSIFAREAQKSSAWACFGGIRNAVVFGKGWNAHSTLWLFNGGSFAGGWQLNRLAA